MHRRRRFCKAGDIKCRKWNKRIKSGFDLVPLLLERKQDILIWSACFQNWSKIFWFGLLIIGTKAKRFDLVSLLSQLKQNILIWSAYYRNKIKTFWFGLLIIGTKAKQFDLLLKLSQQKVSIWSIHTCIYQLQNFISRKLKKSPTPHIGESPTPRIIELGSRYLICNKLKNLISQKVIKLFEQKFQRVFWCTYTARSANLSSLA